MLDPAAFFVGFDGAFGELDRIAFWVKAVEKVHERTGGRGHGFSSRNGDNHTFGCARRYPSDVMMDLLDMIPHV